MKRLYCFILSFLFVGLCVATAWTTADAIAGESSVPADAVAYNGHYYKYYDSETTWINAKQKCEENGGHLATVTDESENSFIMNLVAQGTKLYYFIGLYQDDKKNWNWITNEEFQYSNWAPNEPNDLENEKFGMIYAKEDKSGKWNNILNAAYDEEPYSLPFYGYVCEWDNADPVTWDCQECGKKDNTKNFCGDCGHPAPWYPQDMSAAQ